MEKFSWRAMQTEAFPKTNFTIPDIYDLENKTRTRRANELCHTQYIILICPMNQSLTRFFLYFQFPVSLLLQSKLEVRK